MSTHYTERQVINEYGVKEISDVGWVSYYRVYETVVRRYVTKIVSRLFSPDGSVEVSRIEIPTSYLESEFVKDRTSQYIGVTKIAGGTGYATQPSTQPSTPAKGAPTPSIQPVPLKLAM
jgi:hypothetical protein